VATYAISEVETDAVPIGLSARVANKATLVQRAQRGDAEAFAALFQSHKSRVYSVCLSMTRNVAEAEDLTQDAFLQVFRSIGNFRGESAFSTWLHRVAVNTVLMKHRRRTPVTLSLDEPVSPGSTQPRELGKSDPSLSGAIDRISLLRAMQALPPGCRTIFGLHEAHGYQHHEIAELLNCSSGNSKSQLHKAKKKMRGLLLPKWSGTRRHTSLQGGRVQGHNANSNSLNELPGSRLAH
jgi:RNA polymerase sigma-70 factor (ECF subfamily)